jgi:hypothetical protein
MERDIFTYQYERNNMKDILGGLAGIALVVLLVIGAAWGSFALYATFAPKYTAVNNAVFHQSQQYTDGMAQRLEQYQMAYNQATTQAAKDAIASMVQHDFASYSADDEAELPANAQQFLEKMRGNQ